MVSQYYFFGTCFEVSCSGSVKENWNFNSSTPYAASRAAGDVYLKLIQEQNSFPVVFTRVANVYGEGQQLFRIIPRSIVYMKSGKKIPLHGGGLAERVFIHINDVCSATYKIMLEGESGETHHISTDKLISIRDLVKKISEHMNYAFEDVVDIVPIRKGFD